MIDKQIWKHRVKVYHFAGGVWHWKCHRTNCHGGRNRVWAEALRDALMHVTNHGKRDWTEFSGNAWSSD